MSKELEAINKLFVLSSEYHQKLWCLKLAPVYPEEREKFIDRIVKCLPNDAGELNDLYNYIKQALKQKAKQKKILDILKKKVVNLDGLHSQIQLYEQDSARALRAYNAGRLSKYQLTEEEYDLLKEWLKDD